MFHRRALLAGAGALPMTAAAQPRWPERPLRFFVGFAPGTATDNLARVLAEAMSPMLGQPIVIENRAGAQSTIAGAAVARAAPDGYSVMMGSGTSHGAASSLLRAVPYDAERDFVPVLRLGHITQVLVVRADFPAADLAGFVAHLRANSGRLFWGSGSSGNLITSATMLRHLGVQASMVTYRSPPQALTDLLAGQVQFMFIDLSAGIGAIRGNAVRALAISSDRASPNLPGVPSISTVVPGFQFETWFGMYLPTGTPAAIVEALGTATRTVLERPDIQARLAPMGFEQSIGSAAELGATTAAEVARWRVAVRELGIEPE